MPSIHFSLTGKAVTEHLRGFMLSGEWRKAIEEAKSTFPDVEEHLLISILIGKMKLTGSTSDEDGLDFVEDHDNRYRQSLNTLYSGVVLIDGKLYRPTTVVTDYGVNDFIATGSTDSDDKQVVRREEQSRLSGFERTQLINRALFYSSGGGRSVKAIICSVPGDETNSESADLVVLFEPAFDQPIWFPLASNPQAAVEARAGLLTFTGHDLLFPEKSRVKKPPLPSVSERIDAVLEQNARLGYGFKSHDFGPPFGELSIPLAPLIAWAARHLRSYHKDAATSAIPEWKPVNPSGLKMVMDDPCHTDWMMAAGLWQPEHWSQDLDGRMYALSEAIQADLIGTPFHVLAAGKQFASGIVKHYRRGDAVDQSMIVIVPNAKPDYYDVATKAAATIVLQGGQMSHLAVNGLANNLLIVRIPEAKALFNDGEHITIDVLNGVTLKQLRTLSESEVSINPPAP